MDMRTFDAAVEKFRTMLAPTRGRWKKPPAWPVVLIFWKQ